ncbi:MAG: two-component system response regulator [Candidatus Brocadiia bacterium]
MAEADRILVVDDEEDTLDLLRALLEDAGYAVETAADGETALEKTQEQLPDLVVLDIMMPGMDGLEVCDRLRFDEKTRDVPIIFLTAKRDAYWHSRASVLDAYAYIEKPFSAEHLLREVRNCLNIFGRSERDDDRQHQGP